MQRIRFIPAIVVLVAFVTGCGSVESLGTKLYETAADAFQSQIENDLKYRPYLAREFEAEPGLLLRAMEKAFRSSGYRVYNSTATEVQAFPSAVRRLGKVYELEILTGWVLEDFLKNGKHVVRLQYEVGESTSELTWDWPLDFGIEQPEKRTETDPRYYKNIMELIDEEVKRFTSKNKPQLVDTQKQGYPEDTSTSTRLPNLRKLLPQLDRYTDQQIIDAYRAKHPQLKDVSDDEIIRILERKAKK